jgi:hypothetical protein
MLDNHDIDNMTANQIAAAIDDLRKLQRSGDITPRQADRLARLQLASKRCSPWSQY